MGEIADDMIEGRACSHCGVYFTDDHGHPVLCPECWEDAPNWDRQRHQAALWPVAEIDE